MSGLSAHPTINIKIKVGQSKATLSSMACVGFRDRGSHCGE